MSKSYNKTKKELYNLDITIAKFILLRIEYYIKNNLRAEIKKDLIKIRDAMQQIIVLDGTPPYPKENKTMRAGLFALYKNFQELWY